MGEAQNKNITESSRPSAWVHQFWRPSHLLICIDIDKCLPCHDIRTAQMPSLYLLLKTSNPLCGLSRDPRSWSLPRVLEYIAAFIVWTNRHISCVDSTLQVSSLLDRALQIFENVQLLSVCVYKSYQKLSSATSITVPRDQLRAHRSLQIDIWALESEVQLVM